MEPGARQPANGPQIRPSSRGDDADIGAFELAKGCAAQQTSTELCPDPLAPTTHLGRVKIIRGKREASFRFSGSDDRTGLGFLCKIDGKPFKRCASQKGYGHLKLGKHEFRVAAKDAAGNVDASPAVKKFKI
ncbi:MAG: hypothetical protein EXQ70_05925 [Solirubrobacterales bacterium]|nr:hypothetical protein [Solirubrobacterales bacterium]